MIEFDIDEERSTVKNPIEEIITATHTARSQIILALNKKDFGTARDIQKNYLRDLPHFGVQENVRRLAELAMEYFYFQLTAVAEEEAELEKELLRKAENSFRLAKVWIYLKESLVLASSALEIELKLIIVNRGRASLDDLLMLEKMVRELAKIHPASTGYGKTLITIISHLTIYKLNIQNKEEKLVHLCSLLIRDEEEAQKMLTLETKIAILYNCLKTILGVRSLSKNQQKILLKMYESFKLNSVEKYDEHLLHIFFIIKGLIARKGQALEGVQEGIQEEDEEVPELTHSVSEKLSIWTTVSLDQTSLALDEATRSIIRHRVASLATIIGMKLSLPRFCLRFLELMNDSPFNNEAQTIKLCFQLFQVRDYQRLNACLQAVLSSPSCKNLRQREVLLAMCSIYTGLYLNDRERALMYAKLNHYENKKLILCEETLLQHIGFAYLNLANHQLYIENRQVFQSQALRALKASVEINPKNYLTQYSLGKLLLKMGDLEGAYNHGKESLMTGRGQWAPFALLACIYFCQRRFSKSMALIDELLKKYRGVKNLHYIRAYLQVNYLLLEVEYDQQVEAAKQLGDNLYEMTQERILRGKSSVTLLRYCQEYYQLSLGLNLSEFDENFFVKLPALHHNEGGMMETFAVGYQEIEEQQTLLQIIPLLLEAGQIILAQNLIKSLPASPSKIYQLALLHQAKGEKNKAIEEYRTVISQLPYHTNSLINLSMLVEDVGDALHYLDLAEKFTWDSKLCLAKGLLLSRLGRIEEAHQLFLKQGEIGWYDMLPNLLYYY